MTAVEITGRFHELVEQQVAGQAIGSQANDIRALRRVLKENKHAYARAGGMSETEGDRLEGEVGAILRACSANIERLQAMIREEGLGVVAPDSAAYRAGVVLALSERLAATSAGYDRLRALRQQQAEQEAATRRRREPRPLDAAALALLQAPPAAPRSPDGSRVSRFGSPQISDSAQRPRTGPGSPLLPSKRAEWGQLNTSTAPLAPGTAALRQRHPASVAHHDQQQQQQQQRDPSKHALEEELTQLGAAVQRAESSVREVAALNQAFSAAVSHQTAQIEHLYAEAVKATGHIGDANVQLDKTVRTNRGAQWMLAAFMIAASLGLLIVDWWHG